MKIILRILLTAVLTCAVFAGVYYIYNKNILEKSVTRNDGDYVVLLHGLGRTSFSMQKLGLRLEKEGYRVINMGYPSTSDNVEKLADSYLKKALEEKYADRTKKIHFVTHSMGGIVVRYYLVDNRLENLGRVVMLAPPNHGGEAADQWSPIKITNAILGPALKELTTNTESFVNSLPAPYYDVGIIAGKYDGKVSVEKTKLVNMTDFVVVPHGHTWIMNDDQVIEFVMHFLSSGKFMK